MSSKHGSVYAMKVFMRNMMMSPVVSTVFCSLRYKLFFIGLLGSIPLIAQPDFADLDVPSKHQQVLLVTTESWDSTTGTLVCYGYVGNKWVPQTESIRVVVGKNGLGWGIGLHQQVADGPQKQEGDGKAPAGIFTLGTMFGYDENPWKSGYPYRKLTDNDYFIDDPDSEDYNKWVTISDNYKSDPAAFWDSFERMRRDDDLYEFGVVVAHNMDPVTKGKGSAIFLHVWRAPTTPTLGCTAMSKDHILKVMSWLDLQKEPILVQVPIGEWNNLRYK